ncbi:MAG: lamin tail domain-containing protein [bacterium]
MYLRRAKYRGTIIFLVAFFIILPSLVLIISNRVYSHDSNVVHPGIVTLAVDLYNANFSQKITSQQAKWIRSGSIQEDTPNRWLNHFYDPIFNNGFKGLYFTAKQWAQSSEEQEKFALGDKTWSRAIDFYVKNQEEQAFTALGHILHLIADISVPAHTRDDTHLLGDSFEQYLKIYWDIISNNLSQQIGKARPDLDSIFDELATYSNTGFYSDDSIQNSDYELPDLNKLQLRDGYLYSKLDGRDYRLTQVRSSIFSKNMKIYSLDSQVLQDYANLLLPKAVNYSAEAIRLFFAQAEQSGRVSLPEAQISWRGWIDEMVGKLVGSMHGLTDRLGLWPIVAHGGGDEETIQSIAGINPVINQSPSTKESVGVVISTSTEFEGQSLYEADDPLYYIVDQSQDISYQDLDDQFIFVNQVEDQEIDDEIGQSGEIDLVQKLALSQEVASPGGVDQEQINENNDLVIPVIITAPESQETVIEQVVSNNSDSSSYSGVSGNQLDGSIIEEMISVTNDTGISSNYSTVSMVDASLPDESDSDLQIESALSASSTILVLDTATSSPLSDSEVASSTLLADIDSLPVSTSTQPIDISDSTSTIPDFGFPFPSSTIPSEPSLQVVINEVAWAGTHVEYTNDEWIELYNNTSSTIDLTDWKLFVNGQLVKVIEYGNNLIKPFDYYLFERSDDDTIKGISADAIFSLQGGLKNSGAKLELFDADDQPVDVVNSAQAWFAGTTEGYQTMERIDSLEQGSNIDNWQNGQGARITGRTHHGAPIQGSPKRPNTGFATLNYEQEDDVVVLTKNENPYFLEFYEIPAGKKLVIQPGVIIKSYRADSNMKIKGQLEIVGSEFDPVVFTSWNDPILPNDPLLSSVGTSDVQPQAKDWQGFNFFAGAKAKIQYLQMKYAGHEFALASYLPSINSQSIRAEQAELNISSSSFFANGEYGLFLSSSTINLNGLKFDGADTAIKAEGGIVKLDDLEFQNISHQNGPLHVVKSDWPEIGKLEFGIDTARSIFLDQVSIKDKQVVLENYYDYAILSMFVDSSSTLVVNPGSNLNILPYGFLEIDGDLQAFGTEEEHISIGQNIGWGYLSFKNSSSSLQNVDIIGGGRDGGRDASLIIEDSDLLLDNCKLWNSRAPGSSIISVDSNLRIIDSEIGMDTKWNDPLWPGMSFTTGISITDGKLYLQNTNFTNLNFGIRVKRTQEEYPEIQIKDLGPDNFINVYRAWDPWTWNNLPV